MIHSTLGERARLGLAVGVVFGLLLDVIVGAQVVVRGSDWLVERDLDLTLVVIGYPAAGALGGVIVGVWAPLGRTWPGAGLLGFIVAIPVLCMLAPMSAPKDGWPFGLARAVLELSLYLGVPTGVLTWVIVRTHDQTPGVRKRRAR